VFFVLVAPALIISVARQGGLAWLTVGLRLLVLWALIHLTFQSLLRAREHEADLLAAATQAASPAGAQTEPPFSRSAAWPRTARTTDRRARPSPACCREGPCSAAWRPRRHWPRRH